jgi:hypothetical protein
VRVSPYAVATVDRKGTRRARRARNYSRPFYTAGHVGFGPDGRRMRRKVSGRMSLLWLGAQPEGPAQGPAHPPLGTFGVLRRPGHGEALTCPVPLTARALI